MKLFLNKCLLFACLFFPLKAQAIPYQGNLIYRSTYQGSDFLILSGSPGTTLDFYVPRSQTSFRFIGTDACSWVQIKLPGVTVSNFVINGIALNPYQAPSTSISYNCSSSLSQANIPGSSAYNSAIRTYYWKGTAPRTSVKVEWNQPSLKRARLNGCGFYQLKIPNLSDSIVLGGITYLLSSLPAAPSPPLCRQIGAVSVPYLPPNFTN